MKEYKLITQHVNKDYPLKSQDYKCSYIGRYKVEDYIVLLYKTFTTEAGRGNPEIILATFTVKGEKKDEITALWNDEINTEGVIERKVSADNDLFIDDNPDILDDFPSK